MNTLESALALGLSKDYFATCNKIVLRFCYLHGRGNLVKGYHIYREYINRLNMRLNDMYYSFESVSAFVRVVIPLGLYPSFGTTYTSISRLVFAENHSIKGLKKIKKILGVKR